MPELLGTLLPLTALGNSSGSTNLFKEGERFVDWLVKTHQQAWQLLPLHPNPWDEKNLFASPYFSFGVGLNPLFVQEGTKGDTKDSEFVNRNKNWLDDYSLFMALADHFGTDKWIQWPVEIRRHNADALAVWRHKLDRQVDRYNSQQARLYREYGLLKKAAGELGITIIGDVPFYLPLNSPLVWAFQNCFEIDSHGHMPYVSGAKGGEQFIRQVWGHPLYDWSNLSRILELWKIRLAYAAYLYDWARLDSAIRFYTYGKMHPTDDTLDKVLTAPGDGVFVPLIKYCRKIGLYIFSEDITDYDLTILRKTMARYEVPGVSVFTLDQSLDNLDTLDIHYTSDHDTPTLLTFLQTDKDMARETRQFLLDHCRRLILPIQDWLLTTDRINTPGTIGPENWSYTVDLSKLKAP